MNKKENLDIQGHRGCRGLYPENTIQAFEAAMAMDVTTLELDLAISADRKVVVSHEPFFNHEISTKPDGTTITKEEEKSHNLFLLNYDEISKYDVGKKAHPRFGDQAKIPAVKPLLSEVYASAIRHRELNPGPAFKYNIEIKSKPAWDSTYYATIDDFCNLVIEVVDRYDAIDDTYIQSFDVRALEYIRRIRPEIKLVYLVESEEDMEKSMALLSFIPDVYSPYFKLINDETLSVCKEKNMKLIPWTVNSYADIEHMIVKGVDGIISDYPDRVIEVYRK